MTNKREYRVRVSPRAKHVRLQMSLREGLVIVVPKGYDQDRIPDLLKEKKRWIEKVSKELDDQRIRVEIEPASARPERLDLRAIDETWVVGYRTATTPRVATVERPGNRLLISDGKGDVEAVRKALTRWLRRKAHSHLKPWLRHLAEERGFEIKRIFIKLQRTRWASCSQRMNVNLNLKLLFIPEALVHYVLLHELCHTVHLNHSRKFWALVAEHAPDYATRRVELRAAWKYVPGWVDG